MSLLLNVCLGWLCPKQYLSTSEIFKMGNWGKIDYQKRKKEEVKLRWNAWSLFLENNATSNRCYCT